MLGADVKVAVEVLAVLLTTIPSGTAEMMSFPTVAAPPPIDSVYEPMVTGLPDLAVTVVELPRMNTAADCVDAASEAAVELPIVTTATNGALLVGIRSALFSGSAGSALEEGLNTAEGTGRPASLVGFAADAPEPPGFV